MPEKGFSESINVFTTWLEALIDFLLDTITMPFNVIGALLD